MAIQRATSKAEPEAERASHAPLGDAELAAMDAYWRASN